MSKLAALEVQITADIKDLNDNIKAGKSSVKDFDATMNASVNGLKKFEAQLKKSTDPKEIKALEQSISQLKGKIEVLNASQNNLVGSSQKMIAGTNQANNALSNLSRVAQDAPFGFIGIQNNLNPLLESFQRLKQETGSNVASFKALAGSLMGAGGLGLALSVVSSLYLAFGDKLMGISAEAARAAKSYEEFQKTMASSIGTAQKEIVQSQVLVNAITNVNNGVKDRTFALKQLKEQYPQYSDLQKADINDTQLLTGFQNKLAASLLRRAKAQAYADLYAKESVKLAELQSQSMQQTADKATTFNTILGTGLQLAGNAYGGLIKYKSGVEQTGKEISETNARLKVYEQLLGGVTEEQIKFGEEIGKQSSKGKTTNKIIPDKKTFEQELKDEIDFITKLFSTRTINFDEFVKRNNAAYNKAIEAAVKLNRPDSLVKTLSEEILVFANVKGTAQTVKADVNLEPNIKIPEDKIAAINAKMQGVLSNILKPNQQQIDANAAAIAQIVTNTYANAFGGIGDALAASLTTGANLFEGVFNGILNTFGEGLQQVGKQIIIGSKLLEGITKALQGGSFTKSLLGGIALVALGGVLKSLKIGQNAQGTDYWRGGLTMVGERGPELVNLPRGASVTPNHELGSIGGGMDIQIQPVVAMRGTDMVIYFNKANKLYNSIG
jgi:predicted  nucleic acid-binding Zn-ribbon protein